MLTIESAAEFLGKLKEVMPNCEVFVSVKVPDGAPCGEIGDMIEAVSECGFFNYVRSTAMCDEIVVTDRLPDEGT